MNDLKVIESSILEILEAKGVLLYDLSWQQEGKNKILQVAIMRNDGSMDIELCADISELISAKLDEMDLISFEYFLEVCSPGAERELRNPEQIKAAIDEYVYVKLKDPKQGKDQIRGYLRSYSDEKIAIEYMDKNRKKVFEIDSDNIALITLSVKI